MSDPAQQEPRATARRPSIGGRRPRCLGVLLCYNDGDFLPDAIEHLLAQNHDLMVINHGSDDDTSEVLDRYRSAIVQRYDLPRSFNFYRLYSWASMRLLEKFVAQYDWISWPDQDEILEGPTRQRSYFDWVTEVYESPYHWVQFNNFNFWYTQSDDASITSAVKRIRHYGVWPDCTPRIRAWRSVATNIRVFNHNPPVGARVPKMFNLRHYPMRSQTQMLRRLYKDRVDLQRGDANYHYNNMKHRQEALTIPAAALLYDDGKKELDPTLIFDWRQIYGHGPIGKTA